MAFWKVKKFKRADGSCPVDSHLASSQVSPSDRKGIDSRLRIIMQLERVDVMHVENYVSTALQRYKPNNQHRFFCIKDDDKREIILLNGFMKKSTKKYPNDKIKEAEKLKEEFEQGLGNAPDYEFD